MLALKARLAELQRLNLEKQKIVDQRKSRLEIVKQNDAKRGAREAEEKKVKDAAAAKVKAKLIAERMSRGLSAAPVRASSQPSALARQGSISNRLGAKLDPASAAAATKSRRAERFAPKKSLSSGGPVKIKTFEEIMAEKRAKSAAAGGAGKVAARAAPVAAVKRKRFAALAAVPARTGVPAKAITIKSFEEIMAEKRAKKAAASGAAAAPAPQPTPQPAPQPAAKRARRPVAPKSAAKPAAKAVAKPAAKPAAKAKPKAKANAKTAAPAAVKRATPKRGAAKTAAVAPEDADAFDLDAAADEAEAAEDGSEEVEEDFDDLL